MQKHSVKVKGETKEVNNFFVSQGHYNQLSKLVPDEKPETLDKMFEDGKVSPEIVPCKINGGKFGKYFTWLTPEAYKKVDESGELFKE